MNIFQEIENHPSFLSSFEEIDFDNYEEYLPVAISIELDGMLIDGKTIDKFVRELNSTGIPYKLKVIWEKDYEG